MLIEVPFNYINLLAFGTLLKYENKRSITIKTLQEYHKMLLEEIILIYEGKSDTREHQFLLEEDKCNGKIEFIFNEDDNLSSFLSEYSHYFYCEENVIYLYDEVQYNELNEEITLIREEEKLGTKFDTASASNRLFELLNINKIKKILDKYLKLEQEIEKIYYQFNHNSNDAKHKEQLKKLLLMKVIFLHNLCQNEEYIIDAFRLEANRLYTTNNTEDFDYKENEGPIDINMWKKSKYFREGDWSIDIDDRIYDLYQYAIFGKASLTEQKMTNILNNAYFFDNVEDNQIDLTEECLDEFEEMTSSDTIKENDNIYTLFNPEESELTFYLNYISKLNNYMKKHGTAMELIEAKNRLIYALDTPKLCLYKEENFIKALEQSKNYEVDSEDYFFIEDEVRFMADEVFIVGNNQNTIKKLLFISTYYDLTQDKQIEKIVKKHRYSVNYEFYSSMIFGEQKGRSKKLTKS